MKSQSASAAPGIVTAPRSVVQVPMADGEPTSFGEVSVSASAALEVSEKEEEKDEDAESGNSDDEEDAESGNSDDEEDVDDINHAALPKEAVRRKTPGTAR